MRLKSFLEDPLVWVKGHHSCDDPEEEDEAEASVPRVSTFRCFIRFFMGVPLGLRFVVVLYHVPVVPATFDPTIHLHMQLF